jgi:hypothetical protein
MFQCLAQLSLKCFQHVALYVQQLSQKFHFYEFQFCCLQSRYGDLDVDNKRGGINNPQSNNPDSIFMSQ